MAVEHWRMRKYRLRLEGKKTTLNGVELCSINGTTWFELPSNGHSKEEKPLENTAIYQAQVLPGKNGRSGNGRELKKISGTIKIPAKVTV